MTGTLLWVRRDLRLADNPALAFALARGRATAVFIDDPAEALPLGAASRWWLEAALTDFAASLAGAGVELVRRQGDPLTVLKNLCRAFKTDTVVWSRLYEPQALRRDAAVEDGLTVQGLTVKTFNASLLFEPKSLRTKDGKAFKRFTPFAKACRAARIEPPLVGPRRKPAKKGAAPQSQGWQAKLAEAWVPTESGALAALHLFLDEGMGAYGQDRERPDKRGTSRLSPYLSFGQIGPRQIWQAVTHAMAAKPELAPGGEAFLRQLLWREFSYHLLDDFPALPEKPLQNAFAKMPWRRDPAALAAWQQGQTGYPIVDAGMRELWQTGWMHNRVRMIVASFLVKDLLLPWRAGEAWFWETLVDADLANNAAGWQWVAGCGADAAPYFRIFNPVLQGQKFDPDGAYVRRYVPELNGIKGPVIHAPWLIEAEQLRKARVVLGQTYPLPIVDHALARARALDAAKKVKKT